MKRKLFFVGVILFITVNLVFAQGEKIGYVDSQIILTQFPPAIKAQGDLDATTNLWSAQLDSMTLSYQQLLTDYQKKANIMPEDQQLAAQKNIVQLEQKIVDFRRVKFSQQEGEIFKKQDELFSPVKTSIYNAIESVAKEEGMKFIFDKSGDILLLYADSAYDITYKVLDHLKRGN
ncbi:MAG: OmpH family outer membrane protein [Ignavibacteria bacterium]|nr:MAG: OmpH family outer membrane protein [Ignavibacteria bacterium]